MEKRLDKPGVTYLWNKMKTYTMKQFSLKPVFLSDITFTPEELGNPDGVVLEDSRIKADSIIGIYYSADSIPVVNKAGMLARNGEGTITFTAKRIPEREIVIDVIEIRQR